jgi:hypothetical protein
MANAKKCDRCGNYYQERKSNVFENFACDLSRHLKLSEKEQMIWFIEQTVDLCPCCSKSLQHWAKCKEETEPTAAVVKAKQHTELLEKYNDLREKFVDYVCSGTTNLAPYCLNKCSECVDERGWCKNDQDTCNGFNPADYLI